MDRVHEQLSTEQFCQHPLVFLNARADSPKLLSAQRSTEQQSHWIHVAVADGSYRKILLPRHRGLIKRNHRPRTFLVGFSSPRKVEAAGPVGSRNATDNPVRGTKHGFTKTAYRALGFIRLFVVPLPRCVAHGKRKDQLRQLVDEGKCVAPDLHTFVFVRWRVDWNTAGGAANRSRPAWPVVESRQTRLIMSEAKEQIGMTLKEKEAMEHLVNFWNAYLALPDTQGSETTRTICDAVHVIQGVLAIRVARRANPEMWR